MTNRHEGEKKNTHTLVNKHACNLKYGDGGINLKGTERESPGSGKVKGRGGGVERQRCKGEKNKLKEK